MAQMISKLIITSKDRPELVQRAIDSFKQTGLPITVYDQSDVRPSYTDIERLIGPPEVEAMVTKFTNAGFDRELVQWALVGGYGGYRNVALLDTIGQVVLSTDDDTLCEFTGVLDMEDGFRYGPPEPNWRLFASRDEWKKWTLNLPRTTDVVAEHEKYIGQQTTDGFTFCITASGLLGDSASSYNYNILAEGHQHHRLMNNYTVLKNTREVMQVVPRTTMCPGSTFLRTMNYSFDNRVELPPFPPNGRGECAVFATVLRLVEKTVVVYLPWGITHIPSEGRAWTPMFGPLGFDEAFYAVQASSGATTVEGLGKALSAFYTLIPTQSKEIFTAGRNAANAKLRDHIQHLIKDAAPSQWKTDCEKLSDRSEASDQITVDASEQIQRELVLYGRLLLAWPAMRTEATR